MILATLVKLALASSLAASAHGGVTAHTFRTGVEDTTVAVTADLDPSYGYVWAHDDISWTGTAKPVVGQAGTYDVTIQEKGIYHAEANPITGAPWQHVGAFGGHLHYIVTSPTAPKASNLPFVEPASAHSGDIVAQMFGQPSGGIQFVGGGDYGFTYYGIPGQAGGWTQNG
jgi:hypothetical protein